MNFRKIKTVSNTANSNRNLVLRLMFAEKMLSLLSGNKRILNIDESWISDTNFSRRKWRVTGTTNSMNEKLVQPRISLIAGVDTEGDVYLSLT